MRIFSTSIALLDRSLRARFPFLFWPLNAYRDEVNIAEPSGGLGEHVQKARYSLRLQRYWWAAARINDLAESGDRKVVVVDLGCERGWLKRFVRPHDNIEWVGLDGHISHPSLAATHYDRVIEAKFEKPFPVPDAFADAVVCLHVFEHLPDPEFTAREVSRILKPGGIFLAGAPTAPGPLSWIRTRMLRARERAGKNRHWGHLQKLSPAAWTRLCRRAGLGIDFITGSHLIRSTGSPLENNRVWIRLNQFWGGLFPSLGQEVYLAARKPPAGKAAPAALANETWIRLDWAVPLAAAVMMGFVLVDQVIDRGGERLAALIARHQDGNDVFVYDAVSFAAVPSDAPHLASLGQTEELKSAFGRESEQGRDLHLIVRLEEARTYLQSEVGPELRIAEDWTINGVHWLVLSMETDDRDLGDYMRVN